MDYLAQQDSEVFLDCKVVRSVADAVSISEGAMSSVSEVSDDGAGRTVVRPTGVGAQEDPEDGLIDVSEVTKASSNVFINYEHR